MRCDAAIRDHVCRRYGNAMVSSNVQMVPTKRIVRMRVGTTNFSVRHNVGAYLKCGNVMEKSTALVLNQRNDENVERLC